MVRFSQRDDGGIEALQMSDLKNAPMAFGGVDQAVGFCEGGGDGLFDENIDTGFEQGTADLGVGNRGDGNDGGVHFPDNVADNPRWLRLRAVRHVRGRGRDSGSTTNFSSAREFSATTRT